MILTKKTVGTIGYLGGLPAVLEKFCWAWGQMVQYNAEYLCEPGQIVHYTKATVSLHFFARNSLVEQLQGDWLLMFDTDHQFDPDIAVRMLYQANRHGIDVATALYRHRGAPGGPVIYQWDEADTFALPIGNWDRDVSAIEIGSAGGGCLFVRRSVFDRIDRELHERPFDLIQGYGEDHSFFRRCKSLGIPVYALPHIESPHLDVQPLLMADYNPRNSAIAIRRSAVKGFA